MAVVLQVDSLGVGSDGAALMQVGLSCMQQCASKEYMCVRGGLYGVS